MSFTPDLHPEENLMRNQSNQIGLKAKVKLKFNNKGRIKRHHIKRRTNNLYSETNDNDAKKVKMYTTLAEFIVLNQNSKPKIFKFNGEQDLNPPVKENIPTNPPTER